MNNNVNNRIKEKEKDKIEKYQDLGRELQKIWNVKVKIIPLIVGSLGTLPKQFGNRLKQIGIAVGTEQAFKRHSLHVHIYIIFFCKTDCK